MAERRPRVTEVASAWVSLVPSARGFGKRLDSEVSGEVSRSGGGIGKKFGGALKVGALGVAGAAGGILGTALLKGFDRLQGIDQAEAKLKGLGHSTKSVDTIMSNALTSVKGTAFGLDAAATTAAGAVAAGVKPGKDLERTLSLVGDAATIAGTDMGTMGSIFNKVAASDMIQGDVLAQLGDAGIPVLQLLAKEMGVSATEVRKLASAGEIDFATFQNAMEGGLGGAAQESGQTFSGALANMQAALGRLGANLLGGVFSKMPALFGSVTASLDRLGPAATQVGEWIGSAFSALGPILGQVRDFFSGGAGVGLVGGLQTLGTTITTTLLPVLTTMATTFTTTILPAVMTLGTWLMTTLIPVFQQLWTIISTQVLPILVSIGTFVYGTLVPALVSMWTQIAANLKPIFEQLVATFRERVLPTIQRLLAKFREWLPTIQSVIMIVVRVISAVLRLASAILGKVLPPVIRFAGFLIGNLVGAISTVIGWVVRIVSAVIRFGTILVGAVRSAARFASGVIEKVGEVMDEIRDLPTKVKNALSDAVNWLVQTGKDVITGLGNGIVKQARDWLKSKAESVAGWIPGWIKKRLGIASPSKVTTLLGEQIGEGLARGMERSRKPIEDAAKGMTDAVSRSLAVDAFALPDARFFASALRAEQGRLTAELTGGRFRDVTRLSRSLTRGDRAGEQLDRVAVEVALLRRDMAGSPERTGLAAAEGMKRGGNSVASRRRRD